MHVATRTGQVWLDNLWERVMSDSAVRAAGSELLESLGKAEATLPRKKMVVSKAAVEVTTSGTTTVTKPTDQSPPM